MKSRKRRRWLRILTKLVATVIAGIAVLIYLTTNVFFEPERLVRKLERKRNCRASIENVELSLFSDPATLVIHGLALAERDDFARNRVPLKERPALVDPLISGKRLTLAVSFLQLLFGKIEVHELSGEGGYAVLTKPVEGDNSLEVLFDKPDRPAKQKSLAKNTDKKEDDDDTTIDNLPLPANFKSARLNNFELVLNLVERKTRVRCQELNVELSDFVADASDLETRNSATIDLSGKVAFDHLERDLHYGELNLRGAGKVVPFDRQTRKLEPEVQLQVDVLEGSRIETMPLIDAIVAKVADLEKYGIRMDQFDVNGDLTKEALVNGVYKDKLFTLSQPTDLAFADYQFVLHEGSWIDGHDNEHHFVSDIVPTRSGTERALSGLSRFVEEKVRVLPPDGFRRLIDKHFVTDGRLGVQVVTRGDFGHPKVDFSNQLPDLDDLLKDAAEELLRDPKRLIKGLRSIFK